jgi:hypothetical protein
MDRTLLAHSSPSSTVHATIASAAMHAAHLSTLYRVVDVHVHMEMYYGVFYSGAR